MEFKTYNHKCWVPIWHFISTQCLIFIFIGHFWKQLSKVHSCHHLRWQMKKQNHREGLGHRAGRRLILSPSFCCFHLIYSALLGWVVSICLSRSILLCLRMLIYINGFLYLCLTFEFGYCRAVERNPRDGRDDGESIYFLSSLSRGHIRITATLGQKSPFPSGLLLSPWDYSNSFLPLPLQA